MTTLQRRSGLLLSLAALGAAGMFLGPDGWLGIDVGPVGAAVLYAALIFLAIHLAKNPEHAFPSDAPPAERQAWVAVVFLLLVAIHLLIFVVGMPMLGAAADEISNPASRRFATKVVVLMIGWAVVAAVLRRRNADGIELDERDLRIQRSASRTGSGLMALLIVASIAALAIQPELLSPWLRPLIVANALLGLLILATLAENVSVISRYRRAKA
jgi:amino acid transporter